MNRNIGYIALVGMAISACAAPASEEGARDDAPVASPSKEVARVDLGEGHQVAFVEIDASILVLEIGARGRSALSMLAELDANATAGDLFQALSRPGTSAPETLAPRPEGIVGREQGWALVPMQTMSGGNDACNNASFTASTYGGILPSNDSWLDRHPSEEYDDYLYTDGNHTQHLAPRVAFNLTRPNVLQFRGKACLEAKQAAGQPRHDYFNASTNQWVDRDPQMSLFSRRTGTTTWWSEVSVTIPVGSTRSLEWAWFGNANKRYDWKFSVIRAQPQDFVDYMRSYLD